eukprot:TRINITY_DN5941_c0_g1_i6.p1 TRINITY_DN5941_c0_g1~~TRINITY_DN5941_c0_g1_i6.p1  ORF type:complete len:701 (-),score=176.21 TRINITY_DN5941_c0_g1_i6:226-2328(-)
MEKCRLKIKFKALAAKNPTDNPHRDSTSPLLQVAKVTQTNSSSEEDFLTGVSGAMKRKRGSRAADKKGKKKEPTAPANDLGRNLVALNTEDNSGLDDFDDGELNSAMDSDALSHGPDLPSKVSDMNAGGLNVRPVGRVKVKLRTSKTLEPHYAHSNTQTQSDTDKSNPQTVSEKHIEFVEKMEDSANSLPAKQVSVSEKFSRKAGTIKIKSSKGLGSSSAINVDKHINRPNSPVQILADRNIALLDREKVADSSTSKELHRGKSWLPDQDRQYNENELSTALEVIKKIMKMDAAKSFNAPVNPVALGIPDYFDIIETPMDFGTICSDLEHGGKYMNSEEVFKDVQFIWENCYRYNNKGDYILNQMNRVKKNFVKYWMAAGLHCDLSKRNSDVSLDQDSGILEGSPQEDEHGPNRALQEASGSINGFESIQAEDVAPSKREKVYREGYSKKHKSRRRHGIDLHKSDCLCAVCVVRRRKREREGNAKMVKKQGRKNGGNPIQQFKQEENSRLDNLCNEDASSNLDVSPEPNADDEMEDQGDEVKLESPEQQDSLQMEQEMEQNGSELQNIVDGEPYKRVLPDYGNVNDSSEQSRGQEGESSGFAVQTDDQNEDWPVQQNQEETVGRDADMKQKQQAESTGKHLDSKIHDNLFSRENPLLLQLCGSLFNDDPRSVWNGPHSLIRRHRSVQDSSIHAAVSMFMK